MISRARGDSVAKPGGVSFFGNQSGIWDPKGPARSPRVLFTYSDGREGFLGGSSRTGAQFLCASAQRARVLPGRCSAGAQL
jgi:hypothetical protein